MLGGKRTHYISLSGTCIHPPGSNAPAPPGRCVGETGTRAEAGRACWEGREHIIYHYQGLVFTLLEVTPQHHLVDVLERPGRGLRQGEHAGREENTLYIIIRDLYSPSWK